MTSSLTSVVAVSGWCAIAAERGPVWWEVIDAGSLAKTAQVPDGIGGLDRIGGALAGLAPSGSDFEDVYLIFIEDPNTFRATTDPADPVLSGLAPSASFDSQLWLFRPDDMNPPDALGLLGNNDTPVNLTPFSLLIPVPTDGEPPLDECGLYYLAISGLGNVPVSGGGPIFALASPTEISGPDGPGGGSAHSGWATGATPGVGSYLIAMQSVRFPAPCPEDCNGDGTVSILDFLLLLGGWGDNHPCPCDFDGGGVGISDFLALLAAWGCSS